MTSIPSLGPRGEGWVALQFACLALVAGAVLVAPPASGTGPAEGVRTIGAVVTLLGATIFVLGAAMLARSRSLTALPYPRDDAALVAAGPYRLVRHPIYAGLILGSLGLALLTPWAGSLVAVALLATVLDLKRRREEAWLLQRFPGYDAYRRRTKAFVPFLY